MLALVGRLEVRDWVDVMGCEERIQPLGYLAWAACGKDPGFSPGSILEHAARGHYCSAEVLQLSFTGDSPDPTALSEKMAYVRARHLGGAMAWSLDGDDAGASLVKAVDAGLRRGESG